jgi:hypothetical protein
MRALILMLALSACSSQVVELFPPDAWRADGSDAAIDAVAADTAAANCVCRVTCQSTGDCQRGVDPGSTCAIDGLCTVPSNPTMCTAGGAEGGGPGWVCTTSATSAILCP